MKEVCLVGFAKSTNIYAWELDESIPIWSLNNAFMKGFPRLDVVFDPHHIEHIKHPSYIKGRKDHSRIDWLRSNTEIPIYMLKEYEEVPMSRRYPIEDAIRLRGSKKDLTSTFALMMAFAILEGYERIYVYGFNMGVEYEYDYQLAGGKFWQGFAEGRGIEVIGAEESRLFQPTKIYGYEGTSMITRRTLDKHQESYKKQAQANNAECQKWQGILKQRQKGFMGKNGRLQGNHKPCAEAEKQIRKFQMQGFASQFGVNILEQLKKNADLIEVEPVEIKVKEILKTQ